MSDLVNEARVAAGVGLDHTASARAAAQQIDLHSSATDQRGKRQFNGRFRLPGRGSVQPFSTTGDSVQYNGNDTTLKSYSDIDLCSPRTLPQPSVRAISQQPQKQCRFELNVTAETPLADLNAGIGISLGSISDGTNSRSST